MTKPAAATKELARAAMHAVVVRCTSCGRGYMSNDEGCSATRCAICNDTSNEGATMNTTANTTTPTADKPTKAPRRNTKREAAEALKAAKAAEAQAATDKAKADAQAQPAAAAAPAKRTRKAKAQPGDVLGERLNGQHLQQPATAQPAPAAQPQVEQGAPSVEQAAQAQLATMQEALATMPDTTTEASRPAAVADKAPRTPRAPAAPKCPPQYAGLGLGPVASMADDEARAAYAAAGAEYRAAVASGDRNAANRAWRTLGQTAIRLAGGLGGEAG